MEQARVGHGRLRGMAADGLHLLVLSSLAIAQPTFGAVSGAAYFTAWRVTPTELVLFALVLVVAPPLVLVGLEAVVALVHPRARRGLHTGLVACLLALVALRWVDAAAPRLPGLLTSGWILVALAAAAGVAGVAAYVRWRPARMFVTMLAPAPLLFGAAFLLGAPLERPKLAPPVEVARPAPIVLAVFDEFPLDSLLDARGRIDRRRYPNFAALADDSTWFRNATTVHDYTTYAVPAILIGGQPPKHALPVAADYPHNLFAYLRGEYGVHAGESYTHLCPDQVCSNPSLRPHHNLASLVRDGLLLSLNVLAPLDTGNWLPTPDDPVDHPQVELARFLDVVRPAPRPQLFFIHLISPHSPWVRFPSGVRYAADHTRESLVALFGPAEEDSWEAALRYQRHLLQVAQADRLLGRLVRRLKATGLYDRTLLVVVADHGVSMSPGHSWRRPNAETVEQIAGVPLLVKRPGQRRGRVVDAHVRTVGVLPTIAHVVGARMPEQVLSASLLRPMPAQVDLVAVRSWLGGSVRVGIEEFARMRRASIARKLRLFGPEGSELTGARPHPELIGRPARDLPRSVWTRAEAAIDQEDELRSTDRSSGFVPALLTGRIRSHGTNGPEGSVLISVNGRVVASAPLRRHGDAAEFTVLVPEISLRPGANRVEAYVGR
jgi:hypothetical protein